MFLTEGWSVDALTVVRSGFPFNASVPTAVIGGAFPRPDRIPGQPAFLSGAACSAVYLAPCPGGRALNPAAFALPPAGRQGSEGRNDLPGFGLVQFDLSLGRSFRLADRCQLLFRADAFNLLNHPNFANPQAYYLGPASVTYLQSTQMLNHGLGGLNSLFQSGGPRSLQLSLKLNF
jgi:hypothetical protein